MSGSISAPRGSGYASRCESCDGEPMWALDREGDAVVSWACAGHLSEVAEGLQRDHEVTRLVVRLWPKVVEWAEIARSLRGVGG